MEAGEKPFKFLMEIDLLAADLHRLGNGSVATEKMCDYRGGTVWWLPD